MHSIPRSTRTHRSAAGLALLAALAVAPAAHAQQAAPAGGFDGYVGLTYGVAFGDLIDYDICTVNVGCSDNASGAAGIFAGVRAWTVPLFGGLPLYAEAGWQDFGKMKGAYYSSPPGSGIFYATTSGNAFYAAAKLEVPISEKFSFFGRLGLAQTKVDVVGGVGAGTRLQGLGGSSTELMLGLGWQYRFSPNWSVRADTTVFGGPRGTFAAAGNLGVAYHF
jgi:opacity protein-like surface antigen